MKTDGEFCSLKCDRLNIDIQAGEIQFIYCLRFQIDLKFSDKYNKPIRDDKCNCIGIKKDD
jgi:hypothetical protein